jgi:hypothetical protein
MLKEWLQIRDKPNSDGTSGLIQFLANSMDAEAVRQLVENLEQRPPWVRASIVSSLADCYQKSVWNRGIQTPQEIQSLIEDSIARLLPDEEERWGLSGVGYSDPTIGDEAAGSLSKILPARYQFDRSASYEDREKGRLRCLNTWRQAHELKPIDPPADLGKIAENPNQITSIRFADDGLQGTDIAQAIKTLEGKLLRSEDLVGIICGFGKNLPDGLNGIRFRAVRMSKPSGIRVTVWSRKGKHPETWQDFDWYGGVTCYGGESFKRSGDRMHQNIGKPEEWKEWKSALDTALMKPADSELVVRIGIWTIHQ